MWFRLPDSYYMPREKTRQIRHQNASQGQYRSNNIDKHQFVRFQMQQLTWLLKTINMSLLAILEEFDQSYTIQVSVNTMKHFRSNFPTYIEQLCTHVFLNFKKPFTIFKFVYKRLWILWRITRHLTVRVCNRKLIDEISRK